MLYKNIFIEQISSLKYYLDRKIISEIYFFGKLNFKKQTI